MPLAGAQPPRPPTVAARRLAARGKEKPPGSCHLRRVAGPLSRGSRRGSRAGNVSSSRATIRARVRLPAYSAPNTPLRRPERPRLSVPTLTSELSNADSVRNSWAPDDRAAAWFGPDRGRRFMFHDQTWPHGKLVSETLERSGLNFWELAAARRAYRTAATAAARMTSLGTELWSDGAWQTT